MAVWMACSPPSINSTGRRGVRPDRNSSEEAVRVNTVIELRLTGPPSPASVTSTDARRMAASEDG